MSLLLTDAIIDPDYRNEIQQKYFASKDGYLINEDALMDELIPALSALVDRTANPEVVAMCIGMGCFVGWQLGYTRIPEVRDETLELADMAIALSPNQPAILAKRLISLDVDPVEARKSIFG